MANLGVEWGAELIGWQSRRSCFPLCFACRIAADMQKVLATLGVAFLVLVVALGLIVGYAIRSGSKWDASSKSYVDRVVPEIIGTWSPDLLIREESSGLRRSVGRDKIVAVFQKSSALGRLTSYVGSKGQARISFTPRNGKVITATYQATAKLEHGEVTINVNLVREDERWKIYGFFVNSS